ncbi:bacterial transcriptional regulator family protein [Paraburkholderia xenovorans LB400]|uniref:Transcriptional regulator, IclR family n=1 Tax=Paraburkholderia xenovorans (strain LB400) TaxID=266265 RepID=Q13GC3_PARXL|nr:IclR family transcriptional regulator [Paraburkholderia xenovorans]ABE36866.1 transcriptional regulator, IclR family [Paraburkholderia xenovorans LB400]AIP34174.1 bacterial transcriptional regulator family protein [Paraburkholderia xenovorans LB400]
MSSITRLLSILEVLSEGKPFLSAEDVAAELGCSIPTAYRYVRELVDSSLLVRFSGGEYGLGPRIIKLDYYQRISDQLLAVGQPIMNELSKHSGFDVVMSRWYGDELVDTHRETRDATLDLRYGRGRPRPLFLGAAPKVVLSTFPKAKLATLFEQRSDDIAQSGLGTTLDEFRSSLLKIRRAGFYLSRNELAQGVSAVAAPLFTDDSGEAVGSLALVIPTPRLDFANLSRLIESIQEAAARTSQRARAVIEG